MAVEEIVRVQFQNDEHKRYANLLAQNGFEMTVLPNLEIGLKFRHVKKGHVVLLELTGEDEPVNGVVEIYGPKLFILKADSNAMLPKADDYFLPNYPQNYSDFEWAQLTGDRPTEYQLLERELYIWLTVRPHTLRAQIR